MRRRASGRTPMTSSPLASAGGLEHEIARVHAAAVAEALSRFIGGLPMNPATNTFAGCSYPSCGVPTLAAPAGHHADALAERHGLDLIVRDVDGGGDETLVQPLEVGAKLGPELCVQVREWLVEEVDARAAGERAPHGHALPLTAGELGGLAVQQVIEGQQEPPP